MKLSDSLPQLVLHLCWSHSAWIVGSAAQPLFLGKYDGLSDIDVLVPFRAWPDAALLIPRGTPANSFGGFKIDAELKDGRRVSVDVWPGDLADLFCRATKPVQAWHPASGRLAYTQAAPTQPEGGE